MKRALLCAALAALAYSCAVDPDSTGDVDEIVDVEEVGSQSQASSSEPFYCRDDWGVRCGPINRYDNRWLKVEAQHAVTFYPWGEGGEAYHIFNVSNDAGTRYITRPDSVDSVQWTLQFTPGSTCNTYGNCKYFICSNYTPWGAPACHETLSRTGATSMFTNTYWPDGRTIQFTVYYQVIAGPAVSATTQTGSGWAPYLIVWHTPI